VPYARETFVQLCDGLISRDACYKLAATQDGQEVASILVARDHDCAYLISTGRLSDAHNGAIALLIWQSMKMMKEASVETYDFEGSMIKSIAKFFDSFGGELTPYHRITKTPSKYHRLLFQLFNKI